MFITTSNTFDTHKAAVRSSADHRVLYTATCTSGEKHAAKAVVRKHWTEAASATVREITDGDEIDQYGIRAFQRSSRRQQVFRFWTFNPAAKPTDH